MILLHTYTKHTLTVTHTCLYGCTYHSSRAPPPPPNTYLHSTCTQNLSQLQVRSQFSRGFTSFPTYGDFDPQNVWDATVNSSNPLPAMDAINPVMSSVQCFRNSTSYFPNGFKVISPGWRLMWLCIEFFSYRQLNYVVMAFNKLFACPCNLRSTLGDL